MVYGVVGSNTEGLADSLSSVKRYSGRDPGVRFRRFDTDREAVWWIQDVRMGDILRVSPHRLYFDGASRGNPGPSAVGALLLDPEGGVVGEVSERIGRATNNVAEYSALIAGLEMAISAGVEDLRVHGDSQLVVMQMKGAYRVNSASLRALKEEADALCAELGNVEFVFVRRAENGRADALANAALDSERGGSRHGGEV